MAAQKTSGQHYLAMPAHRFGMEEHDLIPNLSNMPPAIAGAQPRHLRRHREYPAVVDTRTL